jgi:predicted Zn-dependent protease
MRLRDLGFSLYADVGSDTADSFAEHTALIGRIALQEFIRAGRGIPQGFIEEAALRFSPRMVDIFRGKGRPIVIVPVGNIPFQVIAVVCRIGWEIFGVPVRVLRRRAMWPEAYDSKLFHADAGSILRLATPLTTMGRVAVITDIELYGQVASANKDLPSVDKHVYGYGNMSTPVSVSSMSGFGKMDDLHLPWSRFVKVLVHEIGHTYGLKHHTDETATIPCVMNMVAGADGKLGLDFLNHEFCSRCLGDILAGRSQYVESLKKEDPPCSADS